MNNWEIEFAKLIKQQKQVNPEKEKMTEALGIMVAQFWKWSFEPIMEVAIAALEDANYHSDAAILSEMLQKNQK